MAENFPKAFRKLTQIVRENEGKPAADRATKAIKELRDEHHRNTGRNV